MPQVADDGVVIEFCWTCQSWKRQTDFDLLSTKKARDDRKILQGLINYLDR